ncbi:unnamed protein product [Amoebophrya sp. A25]|nr:unnamed protein product [Amoebophrya sp. A25]|eukprot:GSA25T00021655001.1
MLLLLLLNRSYNAPCAIEDSSHFTRYSARADAAEGKVLLSEGIGGDRHKAVLDRVLGALDVLVGDATLDDILLTQGVAEKIQHYDEEFGIGSMQVSLIIAKPIMITNYTPPRSDFLLTVAIYTQSLLL